jgi:cytosine permease
LTDRTEAIANSSDWLPPNLRSEQEQAPLARGPWYLTIGPAYLGIFVWAPFFDSLWVGDLRRWPLPWLAGSAVLASLLCFVFLYYIPATWGFRTGRPLAIVAASTFGTVGSEWITGVAVALASIVWYTVAIDYAVDSTLHGLRACGLSEAENPSVWKLAPFFVLVKSPVYLATAAFWIYITGTSALWKIPGVVVALMKVYSPVALLLLTAVAVLGLPILGSYQMEDTLKIAAATSLESQWRGHDCALQLITGFFALAGLVSVDWGARVERRRDVVLGGLTGIVLAGSWTAIMSLLAVAAAVARVRIDHAWSEPPQCLPLSFRWAVYHGIGGAYGGAILILFGLAALAPACYSAWVFSHKLSTHWPRLGQARWTWIGGAIALVWLATSYQVRLDFVFFGMGLMFGPAIGAMAADWLRQRGDWAGVRAGVNRTGVIAWAAGLGIALAVEIGRVDSPVEPPWWYSSAVGGAVAAFACYLLLARLGRETVATLIRPPGSAVQTVFEDPLATSRRGRQ